METLAIVAVIALLFFGAKRLPELARSLGKTKSEFKKGLAEGEPEKPPEDGKTE